MVTYAKGVPLALKVSGSSLLGKTKQERENAVNKIERSPPKDIQDVLKISFDGLDYEQKGIFLDFACIFKREDKHLVIYVKNSYDFSTEIGLSVNIDKSLIIVLDNKITMHDLLEEMDREIVQQESIENPSKRTEAIKGICLNVSRVEEIQLTPYAFPKMQNLKYLKVDSSHYGEDFNNLYRFQDVEFEFPELRYLFWHRNIGTSLPPKFHPDNLFALDMSKSNIKQLWLGVQNIVNLKCMNLKESKHLLKCPELSVAKNLETLNFYGCTSLIEIHSSIQYLNKLFGLMLSHCTSLRSIPSRINSKSLQKVFFIGCSNLDTMPSLSCNIEELFLGGIAIRELPSSIENLSKLVTLDLHSCTRLENLPSGIWKLESLEDLDFTWCSNLKLVPELSCNIEDLRLGGAAIKEFPSSTECLFRQKFLTFNGYSRLENLPSSISSLNALEDINLSRCSGFKIVSSFPCTIKSSNLNGSVIQELPLSIQYLSKLETLNLNDRWSLQSLPSNISKLKSLKYLDLFGCLKLNSLPDEIGNLEALIQLLAGGTGIRQVPPSIVCLNNLDMLSFEGSNGEEHLGLILPPLSVCNVKNI